ncbi:MAG: HNH endonuclease, partial [Clostridia bacterium]
MNTLLTRDAFRNSVFERDGHLCVICKELAVDAHHIIERRLFTDGGYYIDNGASLCEKHHRLAESTELSCDEIREKASITEIVLPEHFYTDVEYDKWGNEIFKNGTRSKGELFNDLSIQ